MPSIRHSLAQALTALPFALLAGQAQAQVAPTVLLSFNGANGQSPLGSLIADAAGNLYGTTYLGGTADRGTAFKLAPPGSGGSKWRETVLASFSGANGLLPWGSLLADNAGNLYGTTSAGGSAGDGVVFELSPPTGGVTTWSETILAAFTGKNGQTPMGSLADDASGNLYGTTFGGGTSACVCGTVFELSPPTGGATAWTQTVLTSFVRPSGAGPSSSVLIDGSGKIYGTTRAGGAFHDGTVFKLTPPGAGKTQWTETTLVSLTVTDGDVPLGNLIADSAHNLYGTSWSGGVDLAGTVFELSPPGAGSKTWTETVLTSFASTSGKNPFGGLIADAAGNLYGTTSQGGANGFGTVFKLSPPASGGTAWTETVLASFNGANGKYPSGSLLADAAGNLYGTTSAGGAHNYGTVFELAGAGFVRRGR